MGSGQGHTGADLEQIIRAIVRDELSKIGAAPPSRREEGGAAPSHARRYRRHAYSSDFERFWKAYPQDRRVKKNLAYRVWTRIAPDRELVERIILSIREQCRRGHFLGVDGKTQYIPHPTTWLGSHRWEDEIRDAPAPEKEIRVEEVELSERTRNYMAAQDKKRSRE